MNVVFCNTDYGKENDDLSWRGMVAPKVKKMISDWWWWVGVIRWVGGLMETLLLNELWSSGRTIVWVMEPLYFLHQGAFMSTGWKGLKCRWVGSSEQDFLKLVQCSFPEMAIHVWISSPCIFDLCSSHETFVSQYCVDCWSAYSKGNTGGSSICADQTFMYCLFWSKTDQSTTGRQVLQTRVEETNLANSCPLIGTRYNKAASSLFHHHSSSSP